MQWEVIIVIWVTYCLKIELPQLFDTELFYGSIFFFKNFILYIIFIYYEHIIIKCFIVSFILCFIVYVISQQSSEQK